MSRLIRDQNLSERRAAPALLPLSPTAIISHLKACQSLARDHVERAFDIFLKSLFDAYDIEIDKAKSNAEATELMGIQRSFRKQAADLKHYFSGYYLEGFVKFSKKKLNTTIGAEEAHVDEDDLSIVENEDLEENIAISSITQRVDTYFAEPLWALNQRFAILNNGEPVTDGSNPLAPIQFCDALRRSLKLIELTPKAKILAYKVFDLQLLNLFKLVSEDVNGYLQQQGILPNLKFSLPKGAAPRSYLADDGDTFGRRIEDQGIDRSEPDPEAPPEQYQADLLSAIRGLQQQIRVVPSSQAAVTGAMYTDQDLVGALANLQSVNAAEVPAAHGMPAGLVPVDVGAIAEQLKQKLAELSGREEHDAEVKKGDMHTIDLVGMVFQYMLNDENIPDSIKTVLSYLHTPFLKIAFIDPGFFERAEHPARVLLNNLADAGARWVSNDGSVQFDMYDQIKGAVNRVLTEFDSDIKVITSLLFEFNSYVKKVSRKQELTEKRAKEKAEGENKLREMKLKVNDEVRRRIKGRELPSAVLLLLLQPWSDYLTFVLLRHGEKSDKWLAGVELIDDMLWCIEPKSNDDERTQQREKLATIISALETGFGVVGFEAEKGDKLIDSFRSLSELAGESQKIEPAPEPMRNELERIAAEKAGQHALEEEDVTPEEAQMVESLKMIEFGTWFEFSGGKRLKVAWYNGRTSHYMLVDQMGKRVDMESGLALARKMILGEAKIISGSSKPFFERALENIYHKLNEKAGASAAEGKNVSNGY